MKNFENKFPTLFQLFAGYFADADFENLTDTEIIRNHKNDFSSNNIKLIIIELNELITNKEYWSSAAFEANRYFDKDNDIETWLRKINKEIQE